MPLQQSAAAIALGLTLGLVASTCWTLAGPLDKEACDAAEVERGSLLAAGVAENVKKGPAWAKGHLSPHKIKEIERYLELQEILLFRCGQAKLRTLPVPEPEEGAEAQAGPPTTAATAVPQTPPVRPKAATKSETTPKRGTPASSESTNEAKVPAPKARLKPKADDAYRPPPKDAAAKQ